jgi:hypothetical protein
MKPCLTCALYSINALAMVVFVRLLLLVRCISVCMTNKTVQYHINNHRFGRYLTASPGIILSNSEFMTMCLGGACIGSKD